MLKNTINADLVAAMKERNALKCNVLRVVKGAIAAAEKEAKNAELSDLDTVSIIRKESKKREDSIQLFESGGRYELADVERKEKEILALYLPTEITPENLDILVDLIIKELQATGKKDMGKVIKETVLRVNGAADNKTISSAVTQKLK
jgi:uncharacterized protein YqeY